ncbi:MAG TPA: dihydropteroate synthase [Acidimicrobiia bacterium]|nr:dihydropteroate synthase [Acidimicrobiia bacterium]
MARLTVADLPRHAVMGILNVTPASFSDGGAHLAHDDAVTHGLAMHEAGAAIIDVGGESTRPHAEPVPADEELRRVLPVVRTLVENGVRVSIDTTKAVVASAALDAGAVMVNDVSGGVADAGMLPVVAAADAAYVVMHRRGDPRTMQDAAIYANVVDEVAGELRTCLAAALDAGVHPEALLADPGIGFAKTAEHSIAILRALPRLSAEVGIPLLVGASRKSFLRSFIGDGDEAARDDATLACSVWCFAHGCAMVRVHDVAASVRACTFLDTLARATPEGMAA